MTTLAQMENELRAMRLTDSLVRRVMTMADREGCSPTERYMWLAWTAVNMLREVQARQLQTMREAPPAPIEVALPYSAAQVRDSTLEEVARVMELELSERQRSVIRRMKGVEAAQVPDAKKCCVCGTTQNLHKDGEYGYRCSSALCVCF